jgi:hypothetical protein
MKKPKAKSLFLGNDGNYFISIVGEKGEFTSWVLNIDQIVLLTAQGMKQIQLCEVKPRESKKRDTQ